MSQPKDDDEQAFSDAFGRWLEERKLHRELYGEDDEPLGELTREPKRTH